MTVIGVNHVQPVDTDHRRRIVGDRFGGDIAMSKPPRLRQQRRSLELTVGVCHPLPGEPDVGLPEKCLAEVKAMLHSVYDQPDAEAVNARSESCSTPSPDRCRWSPNTSTKRTDLLASTLFPKQIWRQIWSNNANERLNRLFLIKRGSGGLTRVRGCG